MSVFTTVFAGATPIGSLVAGTLAAVAGVAVALVVGGAVALAASAVGFVRQPGGGRLRTLQTLRGKPAPPR
jgi:hypothetical protein